MSIPALLPTGLLPAGVHKGTIDDLYERFVAGTPHEQRRQLLFTALKTWMGAMSQTGLKGKLWIDGGFVTHKPTPPGDIDLVLRAEKLDVEDLDEREQTIFESLLTQHPDGGVKIKPIGGLIDAFYAPISRIERTQYWTEVWSKVTDSAGEIVPDLEKGFVEVTL